MRRSFLVAASAAILLLVACSGSSTHSASSSSASLGGSVPQGPDPAPATAAAAPAEPAQPTGATVDVPDSIAHDCSDDVTSALNSFFSGVKNNSTVRFASGGCYRIEDTVVVDGKQKLLLDGQGAQLRATTTGDQGRRHLTISSSSDITVRDLTVVGSNDKAGASKDAYNENLAFQHAFNLQGDDRILLDSVKATKLHGDFVYIGGNKQNGGSTDVIVRHSQFDGSGRQGISVVQAERVLITSNSLTGAARSMFDIEPNTPSSPVKDVRITGNQTGAAVNFWLADKGSAAPIGPVEIDNNTMNATTGGLLFAYAPEGAVRGPWIIHDNNFIANDAVHDEGSVGAFLFRNCADITLRNNKVTFPPSGTMPAVELRTSKTVLLEGNDFTGASQPVLADAGTTDVTVR